MYCFQVCLLHDLYLPLFSNFVSISSTLPQVVMFMQLGVCNTLTFIVFLYDSEVAYLKRDNVLPLAKVFVFWLCPYLAD
jgi:hypothetical protein